MKNGQEYVNLTAYGLTFFPEKVYVDSTGLFPDNKQFDDQITQSLKEAADVLFEEFKGPFGEIFSAIGKNLANKVYTKIPINQIFLD